MPKPVVIFYYLDPNLGRDGQACVKWALAKWTKWLKGRVIFDSRPKDQADWRFEMRNHPNWPEKIAKCIHTGYRLADIIFDPREPWAKTMWQRGFGAGDCLRTYAAHEIGHAFDVEHSDDPDSIMSPQPKRIRIDDSTLASIAI